MTTPTAQSDSEAAAECTRAMAAELFNHVWTLMEDGSRTAAGTLQMIHEAHASRALWGRAGEPLHWARGEWQIARVYWLTGYMTQSLVHATECLRLSEAHQLSTFDCGYAHEALARAWMGMGQSTPARRHLEMARGYAQGVDDPDDRALLRADLESLDARIGPRPW